MWLIALRVCQVPLIGEKRARESKEKEKAPAKKKARVLHPDPLQWSIDDVVHWAIKEVKIEERHALKLKEQEIDGVSLPEMNEEKMVKLYGIPGGPSAKLMKAIRERFHLTPVGLPSQGIFLSLLYGSLHPPSL